MGIRRGLPVRVMGSSQGMSPKTDIQKAGVLDQGSRGWGRETELAMG